MSFGRSPRGILFALVLATLLLPVGCGGARQQSIVLITLDTTRVDLLGTYGGRGTTPRIDELAATSVRFESAFTTAPYTGPSHASLLTGQNPPRHGLRDYLEQALPDEAVSLAEILGAEGYATAAFVSTYVLDPRFGLDQGFDLYSSPDRAAGEGHWRAGPLTTNLALEWLEARNPDEPFLLWLHLYDAHGPYAPPQAHRKPLARGIRPGSPDARRPRYYEQAGVLDQQVGRLVDALRARGDDPILVVASDHGELLGEHGRKLGAHSNALVDATIRIPLLLRIPGRLEPGVRSDPVSVIDVLPTLLDALSVESPAGIEGRSLLASTPAPAPLAYSETFYAFAGRMPDGGETASLRDDRFVLLAHPARDELFDRETDPGELTDVGDAFPDRRASLRRELDRLRQAWGPPKTTRSLDLDEDEEADHRARLRALGYIE
jgi:arylsulfatase A-like enzyme